MKILYIALKYDYGKKDRGLSFEHYNFYDSLVKMENGRHEIIHFAFDEVAIQIGREAMNKKLLETVKAIKPDLCFFFLFTDEIYPETIRSITQSGVVTYNWFADDHFRFENFSQDFAPNFTWVSTTDSQAMAKYKKIGYKNIIKTQWACNHFLYHPIHSDGYDHQVSFVGAPHGNRRELVSSLINHRVAVDCFGTGWPSGRITQDQMLRVFSNSKVNLNFTKSCGGWDNHSLAKLIVSKRQGKIRLDNPIRWWNNFQAFLGRWRAQIKGRTFEIPGCGGFLISEWADNVGDYYLPDKEMVFFKTPGELLEKVEYYLNHDDERERIKLAGYERTIRDHTYAQRFREIFKIIGLE